MMLVLILTIGGKQETLKLLLEDSCFKALEYLKQIPFNTLFVRYVLEKKVEGRVYVDDPDDPKTYYVVHPYGMSLLFGDYNNPDFNSSFRKYALNANQNRHTHEWMQAYPEEWDKVLPVVFQDELIKSSDNIKGLEKGIVELNTRINFNFNPHKYSELRARLYNELLDIRPSNKSTFDNMNGSVVPSKFWKNAEDFYNNGIGFSLYDNNKLASTAYSAFIRNHKLEIGIETVIGYRGKGYAWHTCAALIDYCLENNYEPIWACRLENKSSYRLAQKLGFEPTTEIPYYRLSN